MKTLFPHQEQIVVYAREQEHPAVFAEMRLGKTLACLRRCAEYRPINARTGLRLLVAAPSSALGSWESEALEDGWDVTTLACRDKRTRQVLLASALVPDPQRGPRRRVCLINREGCQALPEIAMVQWDAVVADESTFLKNASAKVTKFFLKNFRRVPHRWILTGTPCPEGEEEYFCQLAFLRGGAFGFSRFWDFRQHYMEPHPMGYGWTMKPGAADHIRRVVGKTCLVMRRKDVGMERRKIYERREIAMPPAIRKVYDEAEKKLILRVPGEAELRTKWIPVAWNWLRQLCGGWADGKELWKGKLDALIDLLKGELAQEQVVVWCSYNQEVKEIFCALRQAGVSVDCWTGSLPPCEREGRRRRFQGGYIRVLVVQQACAQTGCDLSAADTAIYFSTPPGQMARVQTEDRILSLKKTAPLLYVDLVVKNSVDEDVMKLLAEKKALSDLSLGRALAAKMRERRCVE